MSFAQYLKAVMGIANRYFMKYEIYNTIEDIEKGEWSSLAGDIIPDQQYEWFQAIEHSIPQVSPSYVVVRDNGEAKAIAGLYRESQYSIGDLANHPLLTEMMSTLLGSLTILEGAAPHSSFSSVFLSGDKTAEKKLFEGLEQLLKREKVIALVLENFYEQQPFQHYGYKEFMMSPNTCVTLKWDSFQDYLNSWSPKRQHSIVSSIRKGDKEGLKIKYTSSFTGYTEELYQLKKNVGLHHNNPGSILPPQFYRVCMQYLGDRGEMALCFKDDHVVAFNFSLHTDKVCTVKFVGLDYTHQEAYYFLYAHAIERGIEKGYQHMYFGRGTYTFKERLGCSRTGIYSYVKMKTPLLNLFVTPVLRVSGMST